MITLGVAVAEDDAGVVAADGGTVVGAAWGPRALPCAMDVLDRLGVGIDAIGHVSVVSTSPGSTPAAWPPVCTGPRRLRALTEALVRLETRHLDTWSAAAIQLRAIDEDMRTVIVLDGQAGGGAAAVDVGPRATTHTIDGGPALLDALVGVAGALGAESAGPMNGLQDLVWTGPRPIPIAPLEGLAYRPAMGIAVDPSALAEQIGRAHV